ncbi:MAG TPA: methyl-accepting chemotaxis protein [Polyangium sp.]|nr:methyl-accepting chemotaxis protein [Polyangium sp.]
MKRSPYLLGQEDIGVAKAARQDASIAVVDLELGAALGAAQRDRSQNPGRFDDQGDEDLRRVPRVDEIVKRMANLGQSSQQIGGIVDIINELSEQTKLLSINAAIEAVRAQP